MSHYKMNSKNIYTYFDDLKFCKYLDNLCDVLCYLLSDCALYMTLYSI